MRFRHYRGDAPPAFAHPVERELAHMLDENGIAWEYEPHTFPLARDDQGRVRAAITPDFYLPDVGAYIECTTMRQLHTRKKRKKARELAQQYGEVVTVLYRRDLQRLRARYGRGAARRPRAPEQGR